MQITQTVQKVPEEGEEEAEDDDEEDAEVPNMSWKAAATVLFAVTCLTAYQSELLVGTIEEVTERWKIPEAFIGVILLPIVGNACEHLTAVSVAMKNKLDLTLGVAVGSSTQIALFVTPFAVLVGWAMGVEMTLDFRLMETCIMILSSLIVITVIGTGTSHWLSGVMLVAAYMVVAVVFWFTKPSVEGGGGPAVPESSSAPSVSSLVGDPKETGEGGAVLEGAPHVAAAAAAVGALGSSLSDVLLGVGPQKGLLRGGMKSREVVRAAAELVS